MLLCYRYVSIHVIIYHENLVYSCCHLYGYSSLYISRLLYNREQSCCQTQTQNSTLSISGDRLFQTLMITWLACSWSSRNVINKKKNGQRRKMTRQNSTLLITGGSLSLTLIFIWKIFRSTNYKNEGTVIVVLIMAT